jgi:hypothetical protein
LTILLTDIKGFTDKTSHRSRADIQRLLDDHRDAVLPVLQEKGGRLIKTIGDAFLMVFDSPTDAVLAGVAAQEALSRRNAPLKEEDRIEIRISINAGEVNLVEGDVYGEPVNIAARIEGVAEAGEVYFTEAVYLAMNKTEVPSAEVGLLQLKGIPEKIRVYKVRRETPLGVGQVPAAAAPRPASGGFAPGEKARLVAPAAAPASSAPAAAAPPSALPSSWRRAVALGIDALLCGLILGCFTGGGRKVHIKNSRTSDVKVTRDAKGVTVSGPDAKIALDAGGLRVTPTTPAKPPVTVYDNGKGATVTVDDDEDDSPRWLSRYNINWGFALVWTIYGLIFLKWHGATPGKRIMKLKVVSVEGPELTPRQRLVRSAFSLVSGYVACLGYLWALWDPQKRGWHDHVAGTRVVPAETAAS